MKQPAAGEYLFTNIGFDSSETPVITLQKEGEFHLLSPLDTTLTLLFTTSVRNCVGWRDITTGERYSCPDNRALEGKYEQCQSCQEKTGFNPAFYHATSVSKQQEARNQEPHILYLARFGDGVVKVGISHAKRERSRLLEQGARDALILDTFPTAHVARQYEAKIAAMPGIVETLQSRKKATLLPMTYSHENGAKELQNVKQTIENEHRVTFSGNTVLNLDPVYFKKQVPNFASSIDCSDQHVISGDVTGMVGSSLFCDYLGTPVFLPLKKFVGHPVSLRYAQTQLTLPAQQISLF